MRITRTARIVMLAAGAAIVIACGSGSSGESPGASADSAASADPTKLDDNAQFACDDFAGGFEDAVTEQDRADLARKVNKFARGSKTTGIASGGEALTRTVTASQTAWQLAGDTFAHACLEAGWKG